MPDPNTLAFVRLCRCGLARVAVRTKVTVADYRYVPYRLCIECDRYSPPNKTFRGSLRR